MRSLIRVLSVILALIAAGSIAYIAWELTSNKPSGDRDDGDTVDPADEQSSDH